MRAVSLTEPWATLMAVGEKHFETRGPTFTRSFRGELAIVSSKGFPRRCRDLCLSEPFSSALRRHLSESPWRRVDGALLPTLGKVLCVVEVVDALDAWRVSEAVKDCRLFVCGAVPARHELDFGDYSDPERTVLLTKNVRRLREPVAVERFEGGVVKPGGALGVYTLSAACEAAVRAQFAEVSA